MLLKVKETYHYPKKYIQYIYMSFSKTKPNIFSHFFGSYKSYRPPKKRYSGVNLDVCWSHAEVLRHEITHRERRIGASDEMRDDLGMMVFFLEIRHTHQLRLSFSFSVGGGAQDFDVISLVKFVDIMYCCVS